MCHWQNSLSQILLNWFTLFACQAVFAIFFWGGGAGAEVEAGGIWCVAHDDPVFIRQCLGATPFSLKMFEMIPLPAPSKKKRVEEKN